MLLETIAAVLVGLAAVALILGPLTHPGTAPNPVADEPEDLEETPKGIALAALREIEFDRATGKLSDEDYEILKTRYTAEALQLMRTESAAQPVPVPPAADPAASSDPVEALIADRVRTLQAGNVRCPACGPRPESDALFCSSCGRSLTMTGCAECGAPIVPGSRFCENCGTAVAR